MQKSEVFICLLVISIGYSVHESESTEVVHEILDIIQIAKDIVVGIAKSWNIVDRHIDFEDIPIPLMKMTEKKLFKKIGIINAKVDQIAEQIANTGMYINCSLKDASFYQKDNTCFDTVYLNRNL